MKTVYEVVAWKHCLRLSKHLVVTEFMKNPLRFVHLEVK